MNKRSENVSDNSLWVTSTPSQAASLLPFYITEAGHFYAFEDYYVSRNEHDSFLLLCTLKGSGKVRSGEAVINLPSQTAVLIDCHAPHAYYSLEDNWEFIWFHLRGNSIQSMYNILYPEKIAPIDIITSKLFHSPDEFIRACSQNDIASAVEISSHIHSIFSIMLNSKLNSSHEKTNGQYSDYINLALNIIHEKYHLPLTIEDIMEQIPLSKYHFIRIFNQHIGITPYRYLTAHRINAAKILLRSENISIAEVAEKCGFSDTSNFICQFKKHTGQKPLEYKKYFL
ncbi:MAG: helix-turn-helix transcriptional regulator [Clostridia bacterium]|nr:helix-turn-helix transcriptional regulator [Clostridia bacterium]